MTTELPEPLVSIEADLSDFKFIPLEIARLRRSKAWLICKRHPELAFYMINLWTAAWHELPAASLEDDNDTLADAAMCDPRRWLKVRAQVLRNWVKCSNHRLYHPVVAEKANEAWISKLGRRQQTEAARIAREQRRQKSTDGATETETTKSTKTVTEDVTEDATGGATNHVTDIATGSKGQGQGQGEGEGQGEGHTPRPPAAPGLAKPWVELIAAFDAAIGVVFGEHRRRAFPNGLDGETARQLHEVGVTAELMAEIATAACRAKLERGEEPPGSLRYVEKRCVEAVGRPRRASGNGQVGSAEYPGADPDTGLGQHDADRAVKLRWFIEQGGATGAWLSSWGERGRPTSIEAAQVERDTLLAKGRERLSRVSA